MEHVDKKMCHSVPQQRSQKLYPVKMKGRNFDCDVNNDATKSKRIVLMGLQNQ